jgi:teichuronic acid biosynthesis glycosyltransferase TuaC
MQGARIGVVPQTRAMKLLTFTTLYPNAVQPIHGVFTENRVTRRVADGRSDTRVVAPVPFVPHLIGMPERYARLRDVPRNEKRHRLSVDHPRYFLIPKISMAAAPLLLYAAARRRVAEILRAGYDFDLIDAHYFYPDGVAAVMLGRHFNRPVTISALGSDINLIATYPLPRRMIRWAARHAAGVITVSRALKDSLVALGVPGEKIRVLRNGVDLSAFRAGDRRLARERQGVRGTMLLSVGHLVPLKGHDLAIQALKLLPDGNTQLAITGEGPEEGRLRALADRIGIAHRVRFLGSVPHEALPEIYLAADALLLLSSREGWANVLLEAMACGTPVVGTRVGGTPEVVATPDVGELVDERTPAAIAAAIARLLARNPDRQVIRSYAEDFSWDATTRGQIELFEEILAARRSPARDATLMSCPRHEPGG